MTTMLDINLLPITHYLDRGQLGRSVFYASEPTRRVARSRGVDRLVLYLLMSGNALFSLEKQSDLLTEMSKLFFATQGSVTSAMKTVAEELNQVLLSENRVASEKGQQSLGLLSQWVVRNDQFYLAQSGDTLAYWITEQGSQQLYPTFSSAQGLGLVKAAPIYFSQVSYQPNSTLVLVGKSDPAWKNQNWSALQGQGPEGIRRRLSNRAEGEFDVLIGQTRPGKGKIHVLQSRSTETEEKERNLVGAPAQGTVIHETGDGSTPISHPEAEPVAAQHVPAARMEVSSRDQALQSSDRPNIEDATKKSLVSDDKNTDDYQPVEISEFTRQSKTPSKAQQGLKDLKVGMGKSFRKAAVSMGSLLGKLFPEDVYKTIPSSVMAMMAIVIPLIVVTIASVAYFQLGRSAQYRIYYVQAEQTAIRALEQDDLLDQRVNWITVLSALDQAEKHQKTEQTQALRVQAQFALDNIDLVKRIDYQPAIQGGLANEVNITKMVVSSGDLYLLDSKSGKVLRAKSSAQGYQLDTSFQCGPTSASVISVDPIIDIVAWPAGFEPKASILGVDQGGNLAFCHPGSPITVLRLALPQSAVGSVKLIETGRNGLFVISQGSRAVWIFPQKTYDQAPFDYFDNDLEKPDNFDTTISFAVDREDIYLLHQDGKLTYCSTVNISGVPIRCQDANFIDMRPGRENLPLLTSTPLKEMMISSPPDPSLFFLEPANHSIYHFSLRSLVFQRHYMPREKISLFPATAFTVYPERRTLFLAIGNEVFHGTIP